jgi:hypothetical protein
VPISIDLLGNASFASVEFVDCHSHGINKGALFVIAMHATTGIKTSVNNVY